MWLGKRCLQAVIALAMIATGPLAVRADDARTQALDYLGRGDAAYRMGDLLAATRQWATTAEICRVSGDRATEVEALAKRGEALQSLGQYRDAIDDLERAMTSATALGNKAQLAALAGALGNVYFQVRDFARARPLLTQSLELARQEKLSSVIAASDNNLGNLLAATGDAAGAQNAYRDASAAAQAAGDAPLAVTVETNEGRLALKEGDTKRAISLFSTALEGAQALAPSRGTTYALLAIGDAAKGAAATGDAATEAARQSVAYRALSGAAKLAEDQHDSRAASLGWGYLAELYEAAHRDAEARRLGDRAIILAQETDASDLLYQWEWLEGRLARSAGDRDAAISAYRHAAAALEKVRADIPVDYVDGRSSFRETVGPLYFELADLLLQKSASLGRGSPEAKPILIEARNTVETLKTAEIRDYFKEQCLAAPEARRTTVEAAAGAKSTTAALYPIILPDRVELLLSFSDGLQQFTSRVDEKTLTATVQQMRIAVETLGKRDYFAPGERLYDWLIRPLEPALAERHIDTLVILPDGMLRTIPFAALYDGKEFLVAKYALATAPGLTLVDPTPIAREQQVRTLLAGLSEGVQGYAPLQNVPAELAAIDKVYPGKVLQNQGFSSAAIEQTLKTVPYSVVHIASHGEFNSDPQKTYILTYDGKLTLDNLEDALKYSEFREQPLELLTLSACRTAAGDDRAALGLAGVAIKAGARSAVASLWFISDEASTDLIELFYQKLGSGLSKAKAMQQAQLAMIADRRFRHPGYWSPFLVIGNWL